MYRTAALASLFCPTCRVALRNDGGYPEGAWGCIECGGVWLEPAATKRLFTNADPAVVSLAEALAACARTRGTIGESRSCCWCSEPLEARSYSDSGVELDVCERHGAWFDAKEVQRVAAFVREKIEQERAEIRDFVERVEITEKDPGLALFQWLIKRLR